MHGRSRVSVSVEEEILKNPKKNEALRKKVELYTRLQNEVLSHHQNKLCVKHFNQVH